MSSLKLTGDALLVAEQLYVGGPTGASGGFSVSTNGLLAYQGGSMSRSQLTRYSRKGERLGVVAEPGYYDSLALSPDDTQLAVSAQVTPFEQSDLWTYDVARNFGRRIRSNGYDFAPVWSPDGHFVYSSGRRVTFDLYERPANGSDEETQLLAGGQNETPLSWSADGKFILFSRGGNQASASLWSLPLFGDRLPVPFVQTRYQEASGRFSPDGKWVVYVSDESGRNEIYVKAFPTSADRIQISSEGGYGPRWRQQNEIVYIRGRSALIAELRIDGNRLGVVGETRLPLDFRARIGFGSSYDVSRDGQWFVVNEVVDTDEHPITVVLNWPAGLKK